MSWLGSSAVALASNPNIVLILADDLGYGDLGITNQNQRAALGLPSFATPHIDALALAGTRFNNMNTGGPQCNSSRAPLLTGFHQGHTHIDRGSLFTDIRPGEEDKTWGQVLQDAGYSTALFGKWHLGGVNEAASAIRTPSAIPTQKGFETVYGSMFGAYRLALHWQSDGTGGMQRVSVPAEPTWPGPGLKVVYGDDLLANHASNFIRSHAGGSEPFAAYVALTEPHAPVAQVPKNHPYAEMPWPQVQRDYAGLIWKLDQHVKQIVDAVEDPNGDGDTSDSIANNTIIMFASDNGPAVINTDGGFQPAFFDSNGIYSGTKTSMLEGGIRTPFFVRWDGVTTPGSVNDSYIGSFIDILPTFAELTGQDTPLGIDGQSMLSDIMGGPPSERPPANMWSFQYEIGPSNPGGWSVRVGDWKLIKRFPSTNIPQTTYLLYNEVLDPSELVNRANSRPDIRNALEAIGYLEGGDRQPFGPAVDNPALIEDKNTYFTQYKTWVPQSGSGDFFAAGNWGGGTERAAATDPEALNWNTGPAENWLATMRGAGGFEQVAVNTNVDLLALDVGSTGGELKLSIGQGVRLSARNGFRVGPGGVIELQNAELNTVRDVDVRAGGKLTGEGLIDGQQHMLANIPEFANLHLFEPNLINAGDVVVGDPTDAGVLAVSGDFTQRASGRLMLDLFGAAGGAGTAFDQLALAGKATLGGILEVSIGPTAYEPQLGDSFQVLTATRGVGGFFDAVSLPSLSSIWSWNVLYGSNSVTIQVIENASEILSIWPSGALGDFVSIGAAQSLDVANRIHVGRDGVAGTLRVGPGGVVNAGVRTIIDSQGLLILDGGTLTTPVLENSAGGVLDWRWGTLRLAGSLSLPGDGALGPAPSIGVGKMLEVDNGLNVGQGSLAVADGGLVAVGGATTIGAGGLVTLNGGTLATGSLAISGDGSFDWQRGTLHLGGSYFLVSGGPLGAAPIIADNRTLEVAGNLDIGSGAATVGLGGRISVGGAITVGADGALTLDGGTLSMASLSKSGNGVLHWNSGTLHFTNTIALDSSGPLGPSLQIASQRTLEVVGALAIVDAAVTIGPDGVVAATGTTSVGASGSVTLAGGLLSTSALDVSSGGAFTWQAGVLRLTNGFELTASGPFGPGVVIDGDRALEVDEYLYVQQGSMVVGVGGQTRVDGLTHVGGGSLILDGGTLATSELQVAGDGQFHWLSGTLRYAHNLELAANGVLGNVVDVAASQTLAVDENLNVAVPLSIHGVVQVGGAATISPGAEATLAGGALTVGSLDNSGGGELHFNAGSLTVTGPAGLEIAPSAMLGDAVQLQAGQTLAVTNAVSIAADAVLTVNGGQFSTSLLVLDGGEFRAPSLSGVGSVVIHEGLIDIGGGATVAAGEALGDSRLIGTSQILKVGGQLDVGRADSPANLHVVAGGVIEVGGLLALHSASQAVLDGGTLSIGGLTGESQSSFIWETGKLNFRNGFSLSPEDDLGANVDLSAGQILGVDGTFAIGLASLTIGSGAGVEVNGAATVSADGVVTLNGGAWSADAFSASPSSQIHWQSGEIHYTANHTIAGGGFVSQALGGQLHIGAGRHLSVAGVAQLAAPLTLDGGTLSVGELSGAHLLNFVAGTLNLTQVDLQVGAGGLFGASPHLLSNSALNVSQTINVAAGSVVSLDNYATLVGRNVSNSGEIVLDGLSAALTAEVQLLNAGIIRGRGRVGGPVVNAGSGEVYVQGGRRMTFTGPTFENLGRVSAVGVAVDPAEVVFDGSMTNVAGTGIIASSHARLRFNGAMANQGSMAFTSGDSHVFGDIANTGEIVVSGGSNATFYDDVVQDGVLRVSQAGATTSLAVFLGDVSGAGGSTGGGDIFFEGDLRPGHSPAQVSYENNIFFGSGSRVEIELGGLAAGSGYDQINVGGQLSLGGALDVSLIDGFLPQVGDLFQIITADDGLSGAFASASLPQLGENLSWGLNYAANLVTLEVQLVQFTGDFDADSDADGSDFLAWQRGFGITQGALPADGDANGNHAVNGADFDVWKSRFGEFPQLAAALEVVPEPSTLALLACEVLALASLRRHRKLQRPLCAA